MPTGVAWYDRGMLNHYRLTQHWSIRARSEEVFDILNDTRSYARWWSAVFLHTEEWTEGGVRVARIHSRGWLPYRLNWVGRQTLVERPRTLAMTVEGDFNGEGRWELRQVGEMVEIDFAWIIVADKPLLRYLSWMLKPIFEANHEWAMRQGYQGLLAEIERRRREQPAA